MCKKATPDCFIYGMFTVGSFYNVTTLFGDMYVLPGDCEFITEVTTADGVQLSMYGTDGGTIFATAMFQQGSFNVCSVGCSRAEFEDLVEHLDLGTPPETYSISRELS